jgi:two-component system response regulator HydG
MKNGAFDYLTKPYKLDELIVLVNRAHEFGALSVKNRLLEQELVRQETPPDFVGRSRQLHEIQALIRKVAPTGSPVLILGESGTGKELVARAIYHYSRRDKSPFLAINCAAIPETLLESELFGHEKGAFTGAERRKEGRFRLAEGGTCLLDEIGNLPLNLQAKLLRVLESGQVQSVGAERATPMDVRFVAASNLDLQERVERGAFRSDLYFRLAQYAIRLPPLRERTDDIPFLTRRFVEEAATDLRRPIECVKPAALDVLTAYTWPGNVRELRNVIRQAVLRTRGLTIDADIVQTLIGETRRASSPESATVAGATLREISANASSAAERHAICDALRAASGNKSAAARALKTDYKTLHVKIKNLAITPGDWRPRGEPGS